MKIHAFDGCNETLGEQYGLALYTMAESVQAKDILEIGAGWGWSALAFSLSLENREGSRLISVDIEPQRIHSKNHMAIIKSGIDWTILNESSASVEVEGKFDLIYIDGDPYIAQGDFLRFYPKLRPGGLMVLDGYGCQVGPTEAVDSLKSSYDFTMLPYMAKACHAIHRKPIPLLKKDGHIAVCLDCKTSVTGLDWRGIDKTACKHAVGHGHNVEVRIEPRDLSYTVIQKRALQREGEGGTANEAK